MSHGRYYINRLQNYYFSRTCAKNLKKIKKKFFIFAGYKFYLFFRKYAGGALKDELPRVVVG